MSNWQSINFLIFGVSAVVTGYFVDTYAFFYGVVASMVNVAIYYGVYWRHRRRIPHYLGQALVVVVSTTITRFFIVGIMLVLGWVQLALSPDSLILGFVLGQFFYLINQFITVKTSHGK